MKKVVAYIALINLIVVSFVVLPRVCIDLVPGIYDACAANLHDSSFCSNKCTENQECKEVDAEVEIDYPLEDRKMSIKEVKEITFNLHLFACVNKDVGERTVEERMLGFDN